MRGVSKTRLPVVLATIALAVSIPPNLFAASQDESDPVPAAAELSRQDRAEAIARAIRDDDWAAAASHLAAMIDDGDRSPNVLLMHGTCLNRMRDHAAAEARLTEGLTLYPAHPAMLVERANARAGLGRLEEALADVDEALASGLPDEAPARALRVQILAAMGDTEAAWQEVQQAEEALSADEPGGALRGTLGEWRRNLQARRRDEQTGQSEAFGFQPRIGLGYTSNAIPTGDDAGLPAGVSNRESVWWNVGTDAWYNIHSGVRWRVRLSTSPDYRRYDRAQGASYLRVPAKLTVSHALDGGWTVFGGPFWESTWLFSPQRKLSTSVGVNAGFVRRWSPWTETQVVGTATWTNYHISGFTDDTDADAVTYRLQVAQPWWLDERQTLRLIPQAGATWRDADGSDWDSRGYDVSLTAQWFARDNLTLTAGLFYSAVDHLHDNSLVAFSRNRRDRILGVTLEAEWRPTGSLLVIAGFTRSIHDSNIAFFDYNSSETYLLAGFDLGRLIGGALGLTE